MSSIGRCLAFPFRFATHHHNVGGFIRADFG